MGAIHILDFSVANLIAAGEVVDRPGSAVKELMENAIDAGATQITVEVKRGGVSFIRVTDNGCGMARDDVPTALRRHATSKIQTATDLSSIFTLGFRGEALAAISSVSRIRIMTKRAEDSVGTLLEAVNGDVKSVTDAGCPNGTTVICEELFGNVPARLKFLKKDSTETMYVQANVEKIALSHPEIAVRFIADGATRLATVGDGKLKNTLYSVFGKEFAAKTVPVSGGVDGVHLHGFIGTPQNCRANRNMQNFFINRRYIRSKTVSSALEQAFTSFAPVDKFPVAVLFLEIHPSAVDVNVHPSKLECKFSNDRLIFDTVYYTVRNVLENGLTRPTFQISPAELEKDRIQKEVINAFVPLQNITAEEKPEEPSKQNNDRSIALAEFATPATITVTAPDETKTEEAVLRQEPWLTEPEPPLDIPKAPWREPFSETAKTENVQEETSAPKREGECSGLSLDAILPGKFLKNYVPSVQDMAQPVSLPVDKNRDTAIPLYEEKTDENASESQTKPEYRIVGELFQSYVIVERQNTSFIIDKHAAHERILFEELRANTEGKQCQSQGLLIPLSVEMTGEEAMAALENEKDLIKVGFRYRVKDRRAELTEIPAFLSADGAVASFVELCGELSKGTDPGVTQRMRFEKALYQAACKAAIKAGRNYDTEHLVWICDRLFSLPDIKYCPHGRPVCFEMTKGSIEHKFLRT